MTVEPWVHVVAVLALAGICGLWFLVQRSADQAGCDGSGRCGACGTREGGCEADEGRRG
jgi:hypothetical protein